ncbi:trans-aconitate 2-methyltransferase [Zafaria sp. Z1313]|uniref:trans-aconitate 2-methyltransferase n=1 Tax=unclassified Zafaria TaxID=2828765 RepID=UPI002E79F19D|nr:trans-aconitate 2-methyltransferase [Zafaria sp. J156]MEE1620188.1 trans-aconitate 2-methyltransferase [Zafaria sp. J156]
MTWDPAQYERFADHRDRPFHELTARVRAEAPAHVVDLGCGPGPLTASLAARWPGARVEGLDSSPEMIREALARHASSPDLASGRLGFALADAASWIPDEDVDVLVSNAMLQWIPDHARLVERWLDALRPGAWFAAQVPGNFGAPSHALMRRLASSPRWDPVLGSVLRADPVGEPADYVRLLVDAGFEADVWETGYQQLLPGADPVLEWVRGTGLRPVLARLDARQTEEFEAEYAALLRDAYPPRTAPDGTTYTVFPFRRIFFTGRKR